MITLISVFALLFAIFGLETKKESYSFTAPTHLYKTANILGNTGQSQFVRVGDTPISLRKNPMYDPEGTFDQAVFNVSSNRSMQAAVSPRFQDFLGSGRGIRYSPPPTDVQAATLNSSLNNACANKSDCAKMVQENYGATPAAPSVAAPKQVENYEYKGNDMPINDMCDVNVFGSEEQPIIYDRVMYSNMRSRLYGQGDFIRGDLHIEPDVYKPGYGAVNWFQVHPKPTKDLNRGALFVIADQPCNKVGAYGGPLYDTTLSAAQGDVSVTKFGS